MTSKPRKQASRNAFKQLQRIIRKSNIKESEFQESVIRNRQEKVKKIKWV